MPGVRVKMASLVTYAVSTVGAAPRLPNAGSPRREPKGIRAEVRNRGILSAYAWGFQRHTSAAKSQQRAEFVDEAAELGEGRGDGLGLFEIDARVAQEVERPL